MLTMLKTSICKRGSLEQIRFAKITGLSNTRWSGSLSTLSCCNCFELRQLSCRIDNIVHIATMLSRRSFWVQEDVSQNFLFGPVMLISQFKACPTIAVLSAVRCTVYIQLGSASLIIIKIKRKILWFLRFFLNKKMFGDDREAIFIVWSLNFHWILTFVFGEDSLKLFGAFH